MKITFVRHTSVNVNKGICYGQTDVPVSENFIDEALIVKSKLHTLIFDVIFTSPLSRCTQLAKFCGYDNVIADPRLMELNFGNWEMKTWDEINDPQLHKWYTDWYHEKAGNGESCIELTNRVKQFIDEVKQLNYHHILVFAHAGTIRAAINLKENNDKNSFLYTTINYGEIITINF